MGGVLGHCPQTQIYSQKSIGYPHEKFQDNCMSHSGENMFTYWHIYLHSDSSEITGPLITWRQESNNCSHSWHNSWSNIGPTHHFLTCFFFSSVAITFFLFSITPLFTLLQSSFSRSKGYQCLNSFHFHTDSTYSWMKHLIILNQYF